jgi:hypothetical protein
MAVSRLITLFESLESRTTPKSRRVRSSASSRPLQPPPLPFSDFSLFLHTTGFEPNSPTMMTCTPSCSSTSSPSSSLRTSKRYSCSYSPCSYSSCSSPSSRYLLRRQPSAVDIALQDERNSTGAIGLGLTLMEPRPVLEVPISVGTSHIFDGTRYEEDKQPFFMGGILEVMEGTC